MATTRKYNPMSQFYLDSGDSGSSQDGKNGTENVRNALSVKGY